MVQVDSMHIGVSDHFIVWLELGITTKCDQEVAFVDDEVKVKYRDALQAEMNGFSESIKHRVESGMNESNLVNEE